MLGKEKKAVEVTLEQFQRGILLKKEV